MVPRDKRHLYVEIAFLGQVPVRVKGKVRAGDVIIPSGKNDGIGIAVSPKDISPGQYNQIVGTAWECSNNVGIKTINTAVGLKHKNKLLNKFSDTIEQLQKDIKETRMQFASTDLKGVEFLVDSDENDGPDLTAMHIKKNGNVGIGTDNPANLLTVQQNSATDPIADAWTVYSSRRWKTNTQPIPEALDKVQRLRGVSFDWKANGKHDIGLIAEEVGEVIPEVVAYEENGTDAKSVDYARLVTVLIEAIKEQQQEIEQQQEAMETLAARLTTLEQARGSVAPARAQDGRAGGNCVHRRGNGHYSHRLDQHLSLLHSREHPLLE